MAARGMTCGRSLRWGGLEREGEETHAVGLLEECGCEWAVDLHQVLVDEGLEVASGRHCETSVSYTRHASRFLTHQTTGWSDD